MKSGFVSLIGRTNAGKSSLVNYLLGEDISMVSHKVNATRRKINAIVMNGEDQIIFIDTPGLHESQKTMNKLMIESAIKAMGDCDLILFLASIHDSLENYEKFLALNRKVPHILLLTKIDEVNNEKVFKKLEEYQKYQNEFLSLFPLSIKSQTYKIPLLNELSKYLPEHEHYFDPEFITSSSEREIIRDFILEAIFESASSELPYNSDVLILNMKEKEDIIEIYADIITDTKSHKMILVGKNGETIKRIGIKARKRIQEFLNKKIFLKLNVVIKKSWNTQNDYLLREIL